MDYVSNDFTVVNDSREDKAAALLAYDVVFAVMKNNNREENKKHA